MKQLIRLKYAIKMLVLIFGGLLAACAATGVAIEHRNLETTTNLSDTIFLDPVPASQKTIYLSIRNTTGENLDIQKGLRKTFIKKGYLVVANPNKAHYLLQVNILKVGKFSKSASESALGGGFGATLAGVGTGASIAAFSHSNDVTLAGGLAGGLIEYTADKLVKDVNYTVIADVLISERLKGFATARESFDSELMQGSNATTTQHLTTRVNYKRFKTRLIAMANRVNLSMTTAKPALEQGLVKTLTGIF